MRKILFFILINFLCFYQTMKTKVVLAEEPLQTMSEMVVTATAMPASSKELPVHVQVIDQQEIKASSARVLGDILIKKMPGTYKIYPGASLKIGIRGFKSYSSVGADVEDSVLVLIDGYRAGTGNAALIPLNNVERIEIVRGPGSVLYGASAMGGVINVITKRGKGKLSGSAGAEYGSFNYKRLQAGFSGGVVDDNLGYSLAVSTSERGDYNYPGGHTYENTAYNDMSISGSISARMDEEHEVHLFGTYFNVDDIGNPDAIYNAPQQNKVDDNYQFGSITYNGKIKGNNIGWKIGWFTAKHEYSDQNSAWYDKSTYETLLYGFKTQIEIPTFSFGSLVIGAEAARTKEKHTGSPQGSGVYAPDARYDNYALLAEQKVNFDKLNFLLGLRGDKYELKTFANDGMPDAETDSKSFAHLSWRTGATYWLTDELALRGAVASAFVPPASHKFAGCYQLWGTTYVGNSELEPETSITYEGGIDVVMQNINSGVTYFYTKYDNAISLATTSGGNNTWENVDGRILSGIEAWADYQYDFDIAGKPCFIKPYFNGIYFTERKELDDDTVKSNGIDTVLYVAEYSFTTGATFDYNHFWNIDFNLTRTGPQKVKDYRTWPAEVVNKDPFTVCSLKFTLTPFEHFSTYLNIDNLFDERYSYVDGYPMPGRSLVVGLEYSF
ncbi:TonB-dependent receptor plug domain-containing protein [Desulfovulcanus sp.]